ncbi:hypothetical protein EVAR_102431_1 [Eumeta japonica]|uniref:Uncharacterized protein n=1 Tax=Eumeta variegata TaxID=151549 RepID=A0A4C1YVK7_EUMVA|nr:hypothetical protein EVAR_102431_1 [Eumeta japonica]
MALLQIRHKVNADEKHIKASISDVTVSATTAVTAPDAHAQRGDADLIRRPIHDLPRNPYAVFNVNQTFVER